MQAFGIVNQMDPIVAVEIPDWSSPTGYDLLVEIQAVSVNPVDVKVRSNNKPLINNARIGGYDASGVVVAVGGKTSLFNVGDEVFYAGSVARPGTNMAFHLVDERIVGKKPATVSFADAASLPLTAITAYEGLFEQLPFDFDYPEKNKDKTVLIINGAGGVGSIAIQLAKQAGLKVVATASRSETVDWSKKMGADIVINHHQPLADELARYGIDSVDTIFCLHATSLHWQGMVDVIKPFGYICAVVDTSEPVDLNLLKSKSVTFSWEFMFTRSLYQTADMIQQHNILEKISNLVDEKKIQATTTLTLNPMNAENLEHAHQLVSEGKMIGKVVLTK